MATATKSKPMFSTRNDLSREIRVRMIELLNQQLADTFDLYSQTKQAHWNVKGAQFFQLHELFDKLAEELQGYVDQIAERATALGGLALGTVRMSAADVGSTAFEALFRLIGGERLEGDVYQVPTRLIVRESTSKPRR